MYEEPRDHLLRREKMLEAIEGFLQDGRIRTFGACPQSLTHSKSQLHLHRDGAYTTRKIGLICNIFLLDIKTDKLLVNNQNSHT